jgi:glycosyltransferase involved in cell wall biosynthesis
VNHVNGEAAGLPLVSIIIPCWNRQDYIEDAIDSALRQTYSNVEIVVVDDGSTDRTVEVVRQYGADVKLVQQPNRGVSSARNTGIRNSSGQYIIFLDSDDWLSDNIVDLHMRAVGRWPEAEVYGADTAFTDSDDRLVVTPANWPEAPGSPLDMLLLRPPLYLPSQMYRRRALERIGGFDETMRSHEDSDCLIRVVLTGGTIVRSGGGYSVYRRTQNSLTRNALLGHKNGVRFVRKLLDQFVGRDNQLEKLARERLLRIRLRYWNAFFSFHMSWRGLEPYKFVFHVIKVCTVDPGYMVFLFRDRPWTLPSERAF